MVADVSCDLVSGSDSKQSRFLEISPSHFAGDHSLLRFIEDKSTNAHFSRSNADKACPSLLAVDSLIARRTIFKSRLSRSFDLLLY